MGTRFLIQLLLLGDLTNPSAQYGSLVDIGYMLDVRLNYHVTCLPATYFQYTIVIKELNTGLDKIVAKNSSSGIFIVDGSVIITGRNSWTGMVYNNFAVTMSSNCTMSGGYEAQPPVNLERCRSMFLCDLHAYFIIINGDRNFAAEPLYI